MRDNRFGIVGLAMVVAVLWAGSGMAEVFEVLPYQEALVTIDGDGFPESFDQGPGVGDSIQGKYLRALCAFDLSFLPPGAVVSSAVIHAQVSAVYGDPASLGPLLATRIVGTRGRPTADLQLQWGTFSPHNSPVEVLGAISIGSDLTADLTSQFQGSYPTPEYSQDPGRAVVRFQLEVENNGNDTDDFFYLYRTTLELDVQFPNPITERPVGRHVKRCLPVVASLPGAAGTQWVTELQLTGRHDGSVWLYFTETGQDGTTAFHVRRVDLGMWQTVRYGDVVPDLFGLESTKGWIEVFSTDPDTVVTARVANVGGKGSYGQTVPLVDESKMLRINEVRFRDSYRRLVNLVMVDADNRTNVGLVNLGPGNVTVWITAISPDGPFLGDYTVELAPFQHRQLDRLETVIPETDGVGLVSLSFGIDDDTEPRGFRQGVAVYASRVDNTTGDAVFILPG